MAQQVFTQPPLRNAIRTVHASRPIMRPPDSGMQEFISEAKRRFKLAQDAESQVRAAALEDFKFYAGEQWAPGDVAARSAGNRPCLTVNRLPPMAKQIINEVRQQRGAIQVNPVGDGASTELAEIKQGLIRHIEVASSADIAYDTAFEHMVIGGFGVLRLRSVYVDDESFDQELRIERVADPFTVYWDPRCKEPDNADAEWAFVTTVVDRKQFERDHPDTEAASFCALRGVGDKDPTWFPPNSIRLAEYFWVEKQKRVLLHLTDGRNVYERDLKPGDKIMTRKGHPMERQVDKPEVHWALLTPRETLEETIWGGSSIPLVPVFGDELIVDGERKLTGIVRHAKGAQQQINFMRSAAAEMIALAPRNPWVAAEGTWEQYEGFYEAATTRNIAVVPYKPRTLDGQMVPKPERQAYEPPIQAISAVLAQADADMKSTTGLYDPSLGKPGPEQSGRAIFLRQQQGNTATYNYSDNLNRAKTRLGRMLLEAIPVYYDGPRVQRIVSPDDSHRLVKINQEFQEDGKTQRFDMDEGRYDVVISVGPSYQTRRQEAVATMGQLLQSAPQLVPTLADLYIQEMDFPWVKQAAKRLKKMLPPQLQEPEHSEGDDDQQPTVQDLEQRLAAQGQLMQAMTQQLHAVSAKLETRALDLESRERIAAQTNETNLVVAEMKAKMALAQSDFEATKHMIDTREKLLHAGLSFDQEMALRQQAQDAQQQQQMQQQQAQQPQQPQPGQPAPANQPAAEEAEPMPVAA